MPIHIPALQVQWGPVEEPSQLTASATESSAVRQNTTRLEKSVFSNCTVHNNNNTNPATQLQAFRKALRDTLTRAALSELLSTTVN